MPVKGWPDIEKSAGDTMELAIATLVFGTVFYLFAKDTLGG
jgi:hypothetical protein